MTDDEKSEQEEKESKKIKIDYLKSNFFRVIHADGIFGGVTPYGMIHMDIFSERPTIPQQMVYELKEGESLGEDIRNERIVRDATSVREVEAGIVINSGLAKAMITWLESKIKIIEDATESVLPQEMEDKK